MWEENVELTRRGWEAWSRGDVDALVALWDPDIVWRTDHFHNWPESNYQGPAGIRKFLDEWLDVWGEYEITVHDVIAAPDGRVLSLFRHAGRGGQSGAPMELEMAQIATIRDGRFIELDNYDRPDEALEAAGLSD